MRPCWRPTRCTRCGRPRRPWSTCGCSGRARSPGRAACCSWPGCRSTGRCCCCRCTSSRSAATSALAAGLLMVPQGVGSLLPRTMAGRLTDKIGPRLVVLAGIVLAAIGHGPVRAGRPAHQRRRAARRGPGRPRRRARHRHDRGDGGRLPGAAPRPGAARQQRDQDPAVRGRLVRRRGAGGGDPRRQLAAHAAAGPAGLAAAFGHTFWWCTGFTALALLPALLMSGRARQDDLCMVSTSRWQRLGHARLRGYSGLLTLLG